MSKVKRLTFFVPRSGRGAVFALALSLLACARLLGQQGARLGPLAPPDFDARFIPVFAVALFFLAPQFPAPAGTLRHVLLAFLLVGAYWPLLVWGQGVRQSTPLAASVFRLSAAGAAPEKTVALGSLRLEERRYLTRFVERRRDFALRLSGFLRAPQTGVYGFRTNCDDRCEVAIDGNPVIESSGSASTELRLAKGFHRFSLAYEQTDGPASLVLKWDQPRWLELLPLEHYMAGPLEPLSAESLDRKEKAALRFVILSTAWWFLTSCLFFRAGELRRAAVQKIAAHRVLRLAPYAAAVLVVLYGAILRFDALLVRGHLLAEPSRLSRFHDRLAPVLPYYGAFDPEIYPELPYRADVRGYLERARAMTLGNFYGPSIREPFYVFLVRAFLTLAGNRDVGILVQSLFFSVAALPMAFVLARRIAGGWWALATLVPLALNEWLVTEAPSGYRDDAYIFLLLVFIGSVFPLGGKPTPFRAVAAGVLAGMVCLVRLTGVTFVVPLLGLAAWTRRKEGGIRFGAISLAVTAFVIGPFLMSCYMAYGDPFYSVNFHARVLVEEHGAPVVRHFLYFHAPAELALGVVRGLSILPLRTFSTGLGHFPLLNALVLASGVVGLAVSLLTSARFLTVSYFCHLAPFAFFQNFPSGQMPRFVMASYFFIVLAAVALARRLTSPNPAAFFAALSRRPSWARARPACK